MERFLQFVKLDTLPTKSDRQAFLNCARIMTRIFPFLFEIPNCSIIKNVFINEEGPISSHSSSVQKGKHVDGPSIASEDATNQEQHHLITNLVQSVVQSLFFRGYSNNFYCKTFILNPNV